MPKLKYILFFIILFFLSINVKKVFADAYVIHLYYDAKTQTLSFNNQASQNITVDKSYNPSITDFTDQSADSSGSYLLTFYDSTNNPIISTRFNKQDGVFQITTPYFSIATSLKIFNSSNNKELLSANLTSLSTCNGNGICEYEKGETIQNCMQDCDSNNIKFSQATQDILNKHGGIVKDPSTGQILLREPVQAQAPISTSSAKRSINPLVSIIIIACLSLGILAGGFFAYKKFAKKN